ncbi:MAG: FIST C-terminal domain-containing protein [Proteobacteria bacterium]|nr:FIST C-terminal domain-containing protein [Pseudomonadota bacterium]MBS0493766.1 FIST C-terminal domain-containing protein [Pseudomonadota bacterium]
MVAMQSFTTTGDCTQQALATLGKAMAEAMAEASPFKADFVCAFFDGLHDDQAIARFLADNFPDAARLGGTSCSGVMSDAGFAGPGSIGLLLLEDPAGNYGSAAVPLQGNAADCAERALHLALQDAGCPGELPELIWMYQPPGQEEAVIDGLRRVVGDRCPIIGGSSADNDIAGTWRQIGPDGPLHNGLVVGVLFSSGGISHAFQGGYEPSGNSGIVTLVGDETGDGARHIVAIDGQPAAEVYNRWIGGTLTDRLATGGNILKDTTMAPLGVDVGMDAGISNYLLIHPERILPGGALSTFAQVEQGMRLYSMRGSKSHLVERAGKVASAAAANLPGGAGQLAGAIIVYCAGCMLAVDDEIPRVAREVSAHLRGKPFMGCFTFGEQGFLQGRNVHGNLMISAVAFGT